MSKHGIDSNAAQVRHYTGKVEFVFHYDEAKKTSPASSLVLGR